ncbi:MAG: phosphoribosylglycinamide formyltransferase [Burkholderiales bacterium]|nr:phosphoribosylglycinamide formyltransferase [Burkholderiales bacterium]MCA3162601.1 phosphoribosylglycinamide formyltransferase [Burkholderiales bacterium]MCA3162842.1 phosphoribosylglycinamide formyltransferase [Burkholderiales bacterium]MCA3166607.1 phosphoribosylglycinamide formyltransferase [Burkholderiales bacterium]MCA3170669.1 phosphoribosylglycinamide formyltransferase [Burkholderiales bacterium]
MKNIVILISGRGSNMEAIVRSAQAEQWESVLQARIAGVISNRPNAAGLAIARDLGVPTLALDHKIYATREAFDAALAQAIDAWQPDLVLLAGFMRVLTAGFVGRYSGRLMNIHPSLLPSFAGLDTHQRALDTGVKIHGSTVHFVTPDLDDGPIIIQAAVPVLPQDDASTLATRVLQQEHRIYPLAVRWFVEGQLQVEQGRVRQLQGQPQWLMQNE